MKKIIYKYDNENILSIDFFKNKNDYILISKYCFDDNIFLDNDLIFVIGSIDDLFTYIKFFKSLNFRNVTLIISDLKLYYYYKQVELKDNKRKKIFYYKI